MGRMFEYGVKQCKMIIDNVILIWLVLFISLGLTFLLYSLSKDYYSEQSRYVFKESTNAIKNDINNRMLAYEYVLRSAIALYEASEDVTREEWHRFVSTLQTKKYYPGIQGIGVSMMLKPDEVAAMEAAMKKEYASFVLKPSGKREQYSTIIYLEPLDKRNMQAIGYDMFSQSTRRAAMEKSRDTGLPIVSGPVRLVQEIDEDVQAGVLMYLPLYKKNSPLGTVEERRKALIGFVYSPFRMGDLMRPAMVNSSLIDFALFDGPTKDEASLLYRSFEKTSYVSQYHLEEKLEFGGRVWSCYFQSTPRFDQASQSKIPLLTGFVGLLMSFTIFGILLFLYIGRKNLSNLVYLRTKELEIAKEVAENAAEAKSLFLANMSHEIRTPMNAILGFVEQLAKTEKEPLRLKIFKTIQNSSQTLLTIINDILDFSKLESQKMVLDVHACMTHTVFEEVKSLFTQVAEDKEIALSLQIDKDLPSCAMLDQTRLKQILFNILSNAVKFTNEGGKIDMDISFDEKAEKIEICIADNGIGIAPEKQEMIFHAFEQGDISTTRGYGGTGLGLAITRRLLEMMEASVSIQSVLGEGSSFKITLPYVPCKEIPKTETAVLEADHTALSSGTVLVVEDNKTNQMLLGMILDDLDLKYAVADNGREAVDMFEQNPDYSIILMDENMPLMNGIEAVKCIRESERRRDLKPVPIIAVTANALSTDRKRFLEAGMDDYIAKPYTESAIKKKLAQYLHDSHCKKE